MAVASWVAVLIAVVMFAVVFGYYIRVEEKVLVREFGSIYLKYEEDYAVNSKNSLWAAYQFFSTIIVLVFMMPSTRRIFSIASLTSVTDMALMTATMSYSPVTS